MGCTLLFGVVPALRATDLQLASGLQEAARANTTARQRSPLAGALVIMQVALSLLLVTAAALLVTSLRGLERIDPGFDPENVLMFRLDPRAERLRRAARAPPDGERARAPARHSRRAGGVVLEPRVDCWTVRRHRGTAGRNAVSRAWRPRRRSSSSPSIAPGAWSSMRSSSRPSVFPCDPAGTCGRRTPRERRRSR